MQLKDMNVPVQSNNAMNASGCQGSADNCYGQKWCTSMSSSWPACFTYLPNDPKGIKHKSVCVSNDALSAQSKKRQVDPPVRYRAWARKVSTSGAMASPWTVRLRASPRASAYLPPASRASHFTIRAVSTGGLCNLTALSACHCACLHSTRQCLEMWC